MRKLVVLPHMNSAAFLPRWAPSPRWPPARPARYNHRHDRHLRLAGPHRTANPEQPAHGISIALYNAAFGIIVAVPSLVFHRHFRARADSLGGGNGSPGGQTGRDHPRPAPGLKSGQAMNFRRGSFREEPEINLVPFIDVLIVIVIFLAVTTTYSHAIPKCRSTRQRRTPANRWIARTRSMSAYLRPAST